MKALLNVLLMLTLLSGCMKEKSDTTSPVNAAQAATQRSTNPDFRSFNMPFPEGTSVKFVDNVMHFTLPEPYYLLGVDAEGNFYRSLAGGSGSVTCTCKKGSGCDPIKSGSDYGCLMKENCSSCDKSSSSIAGVHDNLEHLLIMNPEYSLGVDVFEQLDQHFLLPPVFLEAQEFKEFFTQLQEQLKETESTNTKVAFLNAYGYIAAVKIHDDQDNTSIAFKAIGGDGTAAVSCSCNVAGKSCPKDSKFNVVWCNSDNCTSCTMSGRVIDRNGNEMTFTESNGYISLKP